MKFNSSIPVAVALVLGVCTTAIGAPFSYPVQADRYNGNTPNDIPTPYYTPTGPESGFDLFNAVNRLSNNTLSYTKNEQLDPHYSTSDYNVWSFTGSNSASIFVLGAGANNRNTIGVSSMTGNPLQELLTVQEYTYGFTGDGSFGSPYQGKDFSLAPGTDFTFYIDSYDWKTGFTTSSMYYSQPALNPDRYDHLIAYHIGDIPEILGKVIYMQDGNNTPVAHTITKDAILLGFKDRNYGDYTSILDSPYAGTLGDDNYANIMYMIDTFEITPIPDPRPVPEPASMALVCAGLTTAWFFGRKSRK